MSEWHEVKEDDIDVDGDMVNICIGTNYQGAIYVEIPVVVLKKKLGLWGCSCGQRELNRQMGYSNQHPQKMKGQEI